MELNEQNYYSVEANIEYMSASQFKDFRKCEFYGFLKAIGELIEEKTKPMQVGGYVDAYFADRLARYKEENPSIYKKDGTLLKDFEKAEECIKTINEDSFFLGQLKGERQKIVVGEISGVKFKGAMDFVDDDDITDLKCISSIRELSWSDDYHRYVNFIIAYRYDIQGAIYRELERQNTNKEKNFRLACVSKEEEPDKAIIKLPKDMLDNALHEVMEYAPRYDKIKKGLIPPKHCGCCPACRKYNRLNRVMDYDELFGDNNATD